MSFLSRLFGRPAEPATPRAYEGAGGGRRWASAGVMTAPVSQGLAANPTLRQRARHACANNPYAHRAVETWVGAAVGAGIKPKATHPDPAIRERLDLAFETWTDDADAAGALDFQGLQAQCARGVKRDGEALFHMTTGEDGGLRLRQLAPEQLDGAMNADLGGGRRIVSGVEIGATGRPEAQHILPDAPDMPFATATAPVRIPAEDVLHVFEPHFPGQVRGISALAPVLLRLAEHDKAEDAQLMKMQIAAMLAGFIYSQDGEGAKLFEGDQAGSVLDGGLEPGTMKVLPPGTDVKFSDPPGVGADSVEFMRQQLRAIAAGAGVTFEQLTGDYSQSNYSSSRSAALEFRRGVEAFQHHVLVRRFCRPVWRRWMTLEVLSGRLDLPGFFDDPETYLGARWITPGFGWVDPKKEVEAEILAIEAGLKSRTEAVAARGVDRETLDRERAAEGAPPARSGRVSDDVAD